MLVAFQARRLLCPGWPIIVQAIGLED